MTAMPAWERRALNIIMGSSSDPRKLQYFINQARTAAGLPSLVWSERLGAAAYGHALDMHVRGFYAHVSPEGGTPTDRGQATGYAAGVGENIACGPYSVGTVHEAWMDSPGHLANILHPAYRVIGCANVGQYWVENFGCAVG